MARLPDPTHTSTLPTPHQNLSPESRIRGAIFGLAVTDALGAPVEFQTRGTFEPVKGMRPNHNFRLPKRVIRRAVKERDAQHKSSAEQQQQQQQREHQEHHRTQTSDLGRQDDDNELVALPPGTWTDDTSMMLCLATSLIDYNGKHDSFDQVRNYLAWFRDGRFSSVGECFDIGNATSSVLGRWWTELERYDSGPNSKSDERVTKAEKQGAWEREKERASVQDRVTSPFTEEQYCGNGSLMRVLPCALMGVDEEHAVDLATRSSATTHPHLRCVDACEIYTRVVYWILQGLVEKEEMAGKLYSLITQDRLDTVLRERLRKYPSLSSWKSTSVHQISSSGYVLDTLEASLWAIFTTATFRDGALKVVNLGDDADTVGAIYGGLAGMFYGIEEVPGEWLGVLMGLGTVEGVVRGILGFRGRREEQRQ